MRALASLIVPLVVACSVVQVETPDPTTTPDGGITTTIGQSSVDASSSQDATTTSGDAGGHANDAGDADVPEVPRVRFVGRFDTSDPNAPVAGWPGARILARFDGTEVSVTLNDTNAGKGNAYWDVVVDGQLVSTIALAQGTSTYALASGLAPGVHTVEIYKRTEGQVSKTQFLGFDFGAGKLLAPMPAPNRRIEFIVDSTAIGYGIEGAGPACAFSALTENEHIGYAGLVSEALGADHHAIGFSGKGVYWNYTRTDPVVMKDLYPRALPMTTSPSWTFSDYEPDVVWIGLGSNDWDRQVANAPAPPVSGFQNAYKALVQQVRAAHPNAHIFLAVASSLNDDYPPGYNAYTNVKTVLGNVVALLGDPKIYVHEFSRARATNLTGCDYHPNAGWAQSMAAEAVVAIKDKTQWM